MFVESTRFKQVCQLLLSLIVAIACTQFVRPRALKILLVLSISS